MLSIFLLGIPENSDTKSANFLGLKSSIVPTLIKKELTTFLGSRQLYLGTDLLGTALLLNDVYEYASFLCRPCVLVYRGPK